MSTETQSEGISVDLDWDVFLVHSSGDKPRVEELYQLLKTRGLRVFFDAEVLRAGDDWPKLFPGFMDESKIFVVAFSNSSSDSLYMRDEVVHAIQLEREASRRVIPLLLEPDAPKQYGTHRLHHLEAFDKETLSRAAAKIAELVEDTNPVPKPQPSLGFVNAPPRRPTVGSGDDRRLVGRDNSLADIGSRLTAGTGELTLFAISGTGGVGKSALAIEYCYRHADDYRFIWWVDASSESTVLSSYGALAAYLGITVETGDDVKEIVHRRLRSESGWLAVFDNVEDRAAWDRVRPVAETGQVLLTSRSPNRWDVSISIDVLSKDDSIDWILTAAGKPEDPAEIEAAALIAAKLDGLALALSMAAAYISETGCSVAYYWSLLNQDQAGLLSDPDFLHQPGERTVYQTWEPSIQKLSEDGNSRAVELLQIISFYAPRRIPLRIFTEGGFETTPGEVNKIVGALTGLSLVERDGDTLNIHALTQDVTRHLLKNRV